MGLRCHIWKPLASAFKVLRFCGVPIKMAEGLSGLEVAQHTFFNLWLLSF